MTQSSPYPRDLPLRRYFADGYNRDKEGDIRQRAWICLYNPTPRRARYEIHFLYENSAPTSLAGRSLAAHRADSLDLFSAPEVLHNERFGAVICSDEPIVAQITTGYYGLDDQRDSYTRAMHSVLCAEHPDRVWRYADGLVLDTPGVRLKEPEWDFILNPGAEPAEAVLDLHYSDGEQDQLHIHIAPYRVKAIFKDPLVRVNHLFGGTWRSDHPIIVQQTRLIEEEDRFTIRSCYSVIARPGES